MRIMPNNRGQLGKTISTFFVMIGVLIIMIVFVYISSLFGKPNFISHDEINAGDFMGKILDIGLKEKVTVLEGLLKYQEEELGQLPTFNKPGFKEEFANALAQLLNVSDIDSKYPVCLAYSVEKGYEKRRIFIVYDKEAGKQFIYITDKNGEKGTGFRGSLNVVVNEGLYGVLSDLASIK